MPSSGGGVDDEHLEAVEVHVERALMAVLEEYVEAGKVDKHTHMHRKV